MPAIVAAADRLYPDSGSAPAPACKRPAGAVCVEVSELVASGTASGHFQPFKWSTTFTVAIVATPAYSAVDKPPRMPSR